MHTYDTLEIKKGQHLHITERFFIEKMIALGKSNRAIGRELDRPHSTINNEVKRGTIKQVCIVNGKQEYYFKYDAYAAEGFYRVNRERSVKGFKLVRVQEFIAYAVDMIRNKGWSPDAVCGYAYVQNLFTKDEMVSTKTLYSYIDQKLTDLTNFDLLEKLSRNTHEHTPNDHKRLFGKSISERPSHINDRSEFGHWEIDTVIGVKDKHEPVLLTLTERMTRYELILKIEGKTDEAVKKALKPLMQTGKAKEIFKSITADNGVEFVSLSEAVQDVADVYFSHPYTSWERGTNENHNGIIRRFIPKGKRISEVSNSMIRNINLWMNKYPRKIFNYATPHDLFEEALQTQI